jgi:hypothetical protein
MRRITQWSAWLCLSLILWTVAAEPTHSHPNRIQSGPCSVCMLAHSASPVTAAPAKPFFSAVDHPREEAVLAPIWLDRFAVGIRGPPTV